jgi:hypothetical protein
MNKEDGPKELIPVLAKIQHIGCLGTSEYFEVVYRNENGWCSYSGSNTFEDGEKVIKWKYANDAIN